MNTIEGGNLAVPQHADAALARAGCVGEQRGERGLALFFAGTTPTSSSSAQKSECHSALHTVMRLTQTT